MYQKIMRRINSHPSYALLIIRKLIQRHRKVCVRCGVVGHLNIHHTDQRSVRTYLCTACNQTFSELFGTIFYKSKIPIHVWCMAILEWAISTGSVSAAEIARKTGLSHPSAWKMLMKIRRAMVQEDNHLLKGIVESDEAWFGRKENQHIVLGIVERYGRKLRFIIIPNVKEKTLYPLIRKNVEQGSQFFTDSRITYSITGIRYEHKTVNHSKYEFARGLVHTNTIEQIWGAVKGIIRTIHHGVSAKYRHLYLAQFAFRYQYEKTSNLFFNTLCLIFHPTYCLI